MSVVKNLKDVETYEELVNANPNKLVVIDLSAKWCGPCKRIAPAYEKLASQLSPSVIFCKADIDECDELSKMFHVETVPTFIFIKNRNVVNVVKGANLNAIMEGCNRYR